jgi:hypothetical protein
MKPFSMNTISQMIGDTRSVSKLFYHWIPYDNIRYAPIDGVVVPPEDCGGPRVFMALRQQYSLGHIVMRLTELIEDDSDSGDHYDDFYDLQYWLTAEHFNRKVVNQRLFDYASGKEVYIWE